MTMLLEYSMKCDFALSFHPVTSPAYAPLHPASRVRQPMAPCRNVSPSQMPSTAATRLAPMVLKNGSGVLNSIRLTSSRRAVSSLSNTARPSCPKLEIPSGWRYRQ